MCGMGSGVIIRNVMTDAGCKGSEANISRLRVSEGAVKGGRKRGCFTVRGVQSERTGFEGQEPS